MNSLHSLWLGSHKVIVVTVLVLYVTRLQVVTINYKINKAHDAK